MYLTCDDCQVSDKQTDAMEAGIAAMEGPADVAVVVTSDFVGTVRRLTGSTTYRSERGSGEVGAKTIMAESGSTIVVPLSVIDMMEPREIERLLAHETGHVLIHSREEDYEARHYGLHPDPWDLALIFIASTAIDEVRIERDIIELGYGASHWSQPDDLSEALLDMNASVIKVVKDPASQDVDHFRADMLGVLDRSTKFLTCIAAGVITGATPVPLNALTTDNRRNWEDYIEPTWAVRLELYEMIPTSKAPFPDVDDKNLVGSMLETEFLRSMGFHGSANGFWRNAGSNGLFDERLERACRQLTVS